MRLTFITQRSLESRQTVALSCNVVTRPVTVDALWTGLTAAVAKVTRRADCRRNTDYHRRSSGQEGACLMFCGTDAVLTPLAGVASVSRRTLTGPFIRGARCSVLTVAWEGAVWAPAALCTHTVTVDACSHTQTAAFSSLCKTQQ